MKPDFTDSEFMTARQKVRVYTALQKFIASGFARSKFTKDLYKYLSLNFSFIAHYDINGFYASRFEDPQDRIQTFQAIKNCSPWEFTPEPHRNGDLNKAVQALVLENETIFLASARNDRMTDLKDIIKKANAELRRIQGE